VVALTALGVLMTACGSSATSTAEGDLPSAAKAENDLVAALVSRQAQVSYAEGVTLDELFPSHGEESELDSFRGSVLEVQAGRAFDDIAERAVAEPVAFDDPKADWRTFEVHAKVIESFTGQAQPGDEITFGLVFGSDMKIETVEQGLVAMGEFVAFTYDAPATPAFDSSIAQVLQDGAYLSPVDGDRVPFPAIADQEGEVTDAYVAQIDTLAELRALADRSE